MAKIRILLFYSLVLQALSASMVAQAAILFAGGEDVDFTCVGGTCTVDTGGGAYRSAWAREAYTVIGNGSDPPTNRFATPAFTDTAAIWIHGQYCSSNGGSCGANGAGNNTSANYHLLRIMNSNGNTALVVRGTGTAGQVKISSRTSGGVYTDLVTCSNAVNIALTQLDLFVNYAAGGEVTLYSNGGQVCTYSGNVTNGDGATTLNKLELAATYNNNSGKWSEVIVATTNTTAMNLFTHYPNAAGNTVAWTGTNPCTAIVNASTFNDTNYISTGSNSQTEQCGVYRTLPSGTYNVNAVVMSARALVGATGPQHFNFVTRTGGSDYQSGNYSPTGVFSNFSNYIQATNPNTSSAWTTSEISAATFNIGVISIP
jgi:hypothetical protein